MGEKKKDEDKISLWEKSKLGRKTKVYKIKTWLSRLVSLIILIVLLLLGKNYWETHDYDSFIRNALGNRVENDIVVNDIKKTNTIETEAVTAGNLRVYYLDVGQADSILVIDKDKTMLIDAGTNEAGETVVNFLKDKGITKIDYLVGTHPHEDHIGGLDDVIDNFDIGTIYMPKMQTTTKTFEDVLDSITAKNLQVTTPVVGDKFTLTNADCTIMATDTKDTEENLNLSSIVIRMTYGGNSFLFMGDAEAEVEEARNWQPADVLKVGHHGSKTSSTQNFIMQVMPSIAIIQVGKDNSYNLPNQETIDKLNAVGTKIYRTDESGNILVTSDGSNIQVETNVK